MPSYEALIDGKPRRIELTRTAQNFFAVKIENKPCKVELQTEKINPGQAFTIKVDGKTYRIELPKLELEKITPVKVEEATFRVEVKALDRRRVMTSFEPTSMVSTREMSPTRQVAVEGAIMAPMTGKIVQVKVKKGGQVKANQVLCIIEAMKMENEIVTPKAGVIQEVNVSDGSPVNEGEVLFIIT